VANSNQTLTILTQPAETETKLVRAAIYARVSSSNQKNNYSINEQIACCRKYIEQRGWTTFYLFFDEAMGGSTIERPKFQSMLEKAKLGFFDVIVVWKLDRFCRSLVDLVNVERMLRNCSVSLCSVTELIDTTSTVGRFNFRTIGSVAELERELIGERSRMGLHAMAKMHKWPNDQPPLGYKRLTN
jgi:site-specific DNA recombinase